jgi:septum formation protein
VANHRIYLASRSPRRRELLKQIGVNFEPVLLRDNPGRVRDVDETSLPSEAADAYALRIARSKAMVAVQQIAKRGLPAHPVLAADTTVVRDGEIVGKPADADDAADILRRLAGREHRVVTAVALAQYDRVETRLSDSTVEFRILSADEIRRYVATGEPFDKAGAYAVQGRAAAFVTRISGSYSGIMGLPLADAAELLQRFGIDLL